MSAPKDLGKEYQAPAEISLSDLAMFMLAVREQTNVRILADIVYDLMPLRDKEGDLNMPARHLRFLAVGIEEEVDKLEGNWLKVMKTLGLDPAQPHRHFG